MANHKRTSLRYSNLGVRVEKSSRAENPASSTACRLPGNYEEERTQLRRVQFCFAARVMVTVALSRLVLRASSSSITRANASFG